MYNSLTNCKNTGKPMPNFPVISNTYNHLKGVYIYTP